MSYLVNENIATVATKEGRHGAVVSRHPNITNELIKKEVNKVLRTDLKNNIIKLPQSFEVEIKYKKFTFNKLFSLKKHNKKEIVTAFTGLLEMSRRNKVVTEQQELFGDIEVQKNKNKD